MLWGWTEALAVTPEREPVLQAVDISPLAGKLFTALLPAFGNARSRRASFTINEPARIVLDF